MGLLQHLRASGERLATVQRIMTGGSACPPLLIEAFGDEYGVEVQHGWGMTEIEPGRHLQHAEAAPKPHWRGGAMRLRLKQGRALSGVDMKIVDDAGEELPWDGVQFGDLKVRGFWVAQRLFRRAGRQRARRRGLVRDRRRGDHRPRRFHGDHRPLEGRHQVGRRVDQLHHAREHRSLPPRCRGGGGDRGAASEMGRAAAPDRGAEAGAERGPQTVLDVYEGKVREMVAARRGPGGRRAAAHRDRQAAQEGAPVHVSGLPVDGDSFGADVTPPSDRGYSRPFVRCTSGTPARILAASTPGGSTRMTDDILTQLSDALANRVAAASPMLAAIGGCRGRTLSGILWRADAVVTSEQALADQESYPVTLHGGVESTARLAGRDTDECRCAPAGNAGAPHNPA